MDAFLDGVAGRMWWRLVCELRYVVQYIEWFFPSFGEIRQSCIVL